MSSRNRHLQPSERQLATALYRALNEAVTLITAGLRDADEILRRARATIPERPDLRLEYLQIVDVEDLQPVIEVGGQVLVAGAMWIGQTRLIDNIVVTR
jgi:pantoate--beta-alanine ligase